MRREYSEYQEQTRRIDDSTEDYMFSGVQYFKEATKPIRNAGKAAGIATPIFVLTTYTSSLSSILLLLPKLLVKKLEDCIYKYSTSFDIDKYGKFLNCILVCNLLLVFFDMWGAKSYFDFANEIINSLNN